MSHPKSVDRGRFQIYDPIGKGGVATVYRAYDRARNEMCALKLLNADAADDGTRRARFLSEAQTLRSLDHPHIVPVRAVGEAGDRLWIAMELMGGGSAARALKRRGPLPPLEALDVVHKVLQALQVAHDRGIVHRDVKPQNILLGEDGAVKLCDFGIARQERPKDDDGDDAALTRMFDRLGSIIYMAPEQRADARDVSPATDIYACGATLYALLSGQRPPDLSRAPIRPRMLDPIAPPLRPLILRACAVDPSQRFPSAEAMARAVAEVMDHARHNARWYERPLVRQATRRADDYARWPERPKDGGGGAEPRAMYRPEPEPQPVREPAGAVEEAPAPPGRGAPSPAPDPGPPGGKGLPLGVWVGIASGVAALLFFGGLGGGLAILYLLSR